MGEGKRERSELEREERGEEKRGKWGKELRGKLSTEKVVYGDEKKRR